MANGVMFSTGQWREFNKHLSTVDAVMCDLSKKYGMRLLGDIHGEWPSRRLRKRRWFKFYEIRFSLNADYIADERLFYELLYVYYSSWWLGKWFIKMLRHRKVAEYSIEKMRDSDLLRRDIEKLLADMKL